MCYQFVLIYFFGDTHKTSRQRIWTSLSRLILSEINSVMSKIFCRKSWRWTWKKAADFLPKYLSLFVHLSSNLSLGLDTSILSFCSILISTTSSYLCVCFYLFLWVFRLYVSIYKSVCSKISVCARVSVSGSTPNFRFPCLCLIFVCLSILIYLARSIVLSLHLPFSFVCRLTLSGTKGSFLQISNHYFTSVYKF